MQVMIDSSDQLHAASLWLLQVGVLLRVHFFAAANVTGATAHEVWLLQVGVPLWVHFFSAANGTGASAHAIEKDYAEFPQSTFSDTPPCSSHSGTVLYETNVAGLKGNLDVRSFPHGGHVFWTED